jgi:hypothetical protein
MLDSGFERGEACRRKEISRDVRWGRLRSGRRARAAAVGIVENDRAADTIIHNTPNTAAGCFLHFGYSAAVFHVGLSERYEHRMNKPFALGRGKPPPR